MRNLTTLFLAAAAAAFIANSSQAGTLLAYYEFEDNYDSTGGGPAAIPMQNPDELSFTSGFRGQGVDINDPSAAKNTGGSIDIPIDANPGVLPGVTFGGWLKVDTFEFDGFMAIDNGGWDRGITVGQDRGPFGIASGGGPATTGEITHEWQYVVGTFNDEEDRTVLYVGDASAANQTTETAEGNDNTGSGLTVIEIGRYDNQDLDALVDDIFVWDSELNAHEVNAIRNLRLSSLDLSPRDAAELFALHDASASGPVGGLSWSPASGLDATNPGAVLELGGGEFGLVLADDGSGLVGLGGVPAVPTVSEWGLIIMALLILTAGTVVICRKRRTVSA